MMILRKFLVLILCLAAGLSVARAQTPSQTLAPEAPVQEKPKKRLNLDSHPLPLGGALQSPRVWQAYKARFITDRGRVVDTGNNFISHSEGQGYGMLLAVAANDRPIFDRLWNWTRANLMVRDDSLIAWRWEPTQRPAVSDMNNATDGDILVAWALAEAGELWGDASYRVAGRRIATELARKLVLFRTKLGAILLPARSGFHADERVDGPVVNLSYYVFPAFARFDLVAPEFDWAGLTQTGLDLLDATRASPQSPPADWLALKDWKVRPAAGFPPLFSYNAVRVPLYMAWAGLGESEQYAPFAAWAARSRGSPPIVDVTSGRDVGVFGETGIGAVASLVSCVVEGTKLPANFAASHPNENYYAATLHMLAVVAAQMRYASCLRG
jgi:endo-1,4-beta-D-glucanase Y